MPPSFLTRWLLAALVLGLLLSARLPTHVAKRVGKWPRAALDFLILPVAEPLQRITAQIPGIAPKSPDAPEDAQTLREQLAWAKHQNELLKAQLRAEREANRWFAQIEPFVKFSEVTPIPVGVATWSGKYERPSLTLSGGSENGVRPRQIVVGTAAELVGVVEDAMAPFSSRVRALSWPGTVLDCRIVPGKKEGGKLDAATVAASVEESIKVRLKANADGTAFEGDLEREIKVAVGDEVILDDASFGGYARGFVIGKVVRLQDPHPDPNRNLFYQQVVVKGAGDLARLSQVIVLAPRQEDKPASKPEATLQTPIKPQPQTVPSKEQPR